MFRKSISQGFSAEGNSTAKSCYAGADYEVVYGGETVIPLGSYSYL
jgi:hypothetical protein